MHGAVDSPGGTMCAMDGPRETGAWGPCTERLLIHAVEGLYTHKVSANRDTTAHFIVYI